jgi:hypothetical protein
LSWNLGPAAAPEFDTPRHRGTEIKCQSLDPGSKDFAVEIDQQSSRLAEYPHVRKELRLMEPEQPFHTLDLHDHHVFDEDVRPVFTDHLALVVDRDM